MNPAFALATENGSFLPGKETQFPIGFLIMPPTTHKRTVGEDRIVVPLKDASNGQNLCSKSGDRTIRKKTSSGQRSTDIGLPFPWDFSSDPSA